MLGMIVGIVVIAYAAIALIGVAFVALAMLFGSVSSVAASLLSGALSLKGILIGAVIGFFAVRYLRDRNTDMVQNG